MASLTAKQIDGHTYYYARYCQRVQGKPKIVRQVYLGKLEDLVAAAEQSHQPPQPLQTEVAAFGDVAALFDIAAQLDLVPLLDSVLPHKRRQGLSTGQYLLLAAINRAVCPTSKLQFADWYQQTVLTRLVPADPAWLSAQHFWNPMRNARKRGPGHPRAYPRVRTADDPTAGGTFSTRSPRAGLRWHQFLHLHQQPHPRRTAPARP